MLRPDERRRLFLVKGVRMHRTNPYASPETKSGLVAEETPPRRFRARDYIVPTLIGSVLGAILLAPFCRGPGDPDGHSIGAGVGGLVGLFAGIVIHTMVTTFQRLR